MKRPRHLSSDERALWDSVARQAVRMRPAQNVPDTQIEEPQPNKTERTQLPRFRVGEKTVSAPAALNAQTSQKASIHMDAGAFSKLKRGKLSPERRIDLHGLTLAQAHPVLIRFVMDAHSDGKRLVLVITGKGDRKDPKGPFEVQRGVLRRQVPMWLQAPPLGGVVLQVVSSHQKHGGDGALYVYLRRRR